MKTYQASNSHIHVIARGFLVQGEDVILCRAKGAKHFFLPGGHVEDGESASTALMRELIEEIGNNDFCIKSFVGVCENIFLLRENTWQHEINIVYEVAVPLVAVIQSQESHIEFVSVNKKDLPECEILPATLKDNLLVWLENKQPFLVSVKN